MPHKTGVWLPLVLAFLYTGCVTSQNSTQTLPPFTPGSNPCQSSDAIRLPSSDKCLVLVKGSKNWLEAQTTCEKAGGSLFKVPSARLYSRTHLMNCLASNEDSGYHDLWLNWVSLWSAQFLWTNQTILNKVAYCSSQLPATKGAQITSDTLSVDYCVSTCHDDGARFIVLDATGKNPRCNCIHNLDPKYKVPCHTPIFNYNDRSRYYIVHSKTNSLIKVGSADTFSSTEIMCATVDDETLTDKEMRSDTCFSRRPFICQLGTAEECVEAKEKLQCLGRECLFPCNNKCLKRVNYLYTWYAAYSYCAGLGGSLWTMDDFDDMKQVAQFLDPKSRYWIGATNYAWDLNATSRAFEQLGTDYGKQKCGHMFLEMTTDGRRWRWSDTGCRQNKSFLCEFEDHRISGGERVEHDDVACPWPVIYTGGPVTGVTPTEVPLQESKQDDSFPVAAMIAGIVAGLILLTCLGLAFAFCGRRHWHKVREHLTFIPYFSDNSHLVMGNSHDFENMSQVGHSRSHMSSVSEHGSQTGLVKGGYSQYGMMSSSAHQESSGMFSSKSLDRRQMESMGHKLADSQHYLASANNSMDERGFAASYSTMPSKQKEYMTLQAHMDIQDDAQLQAMRRSLRGKPEMTLVTDNVDMNLTVNHAAGTLGNGFASGTGNSTERVMEEVTLPVSEAGVILSFPERVQDAHVYTTYTSGGPTQHQVM